MNTRMAGAALGAALCCITARAAWENDELKTGSFHFGGVDWSAITFGWDGE